MSYPDVLREIVEKNSEKITTENQTGFLGIAADAEDDPTMSNCIKEYLETLASDQGVDVDSVSLENADCNDLFDMLDQ
jgi:hypothetical protein